MLTVGNPSGNRASYEPLLIHLRLIERRIGHDEVELADQLVPVVVVRVGLADVAGEAVDGKVEAAKTQRVRHFIEAEQADLPSSLSDLTPTATGG